ncbi:MAG: PHP-associated domain-containing protein [bacterium]
MVRFKKQIHKQFPHLGKADLHIHSNFSDGKPSIEEILEYVENETDFCVIAITDHDTINGAIYAKELMAKKKYRFDLVVGEEVSSNEGHILALYINEKIEPLQPAHEVIKNIHKQGGIAIAAHPFLTTRFNSNKVYAAKGIGAAGLIKEKNGLDGIETVNGIPTYEQENLKAKYINQLLLFEAEVGGSDAHILESIGKGFTIFEGQTASDLKEAILDSQTQSMNDKWELNGIFRYAFFMWPKGFRILIRTIVFGPRKKQAEIIKFPSHRRMEKEIKSESAKQITE